MVWYHIAQNWWDKGASCKTSSGHSCSAMPARCRGDPKPTSRCFYESSHKTTDSTPYPTLSRLFSGQATAGSGIAVLKSRSLSEEERQKNLRLLQSILRALPMRSHFSSWIHGSVWVLMSTSHCEVSMLEHLSACLSLAWVKHQTLLPLASDVVDPGCTGLVRDTEGGGAFLALHEPLPQWSCGLYLFLVPTSTCLQMHCSSPVEYSATPFLGPVLTTFRFFYYWASCCWPPVCHNKSISL